MSDDITFPKNSEDDRSLDQILQTYGLDIPTVYAALQPKEVDLDEIGKRWAIHAYDHSEEMYSIPLADLNLLNWLKSQGHLTAQPVPDGLVLVPSEYIDAMEELIEVAQLRGDQELPHPADEEKLWTARMQDAWGDAIYQVENLRTPPKQEDE